MDRKARFSLAKNYALYYGFGRANELAQFDIAIVEPAGHTQESIQKIKSLGALTIAYLSVIEVPPWSEDLKNLPLCDFLHIEEKPYINQKYGNYWIDLRSPRWAEMLFERVRVLLDVLGYDGLFMDTVGYVESDHLSGRLRTKLIKAATNFIRELRKRFPDHLLIQNCGLETLFQKTAGYLDGVCWENPPFNQFTSKTWAAKVIRNLEIKKAAHGLQVFLLVEENDPCARDFHLVEYVASKKQFLVYHAPSCYTAGVSEKFGKSNLHRIGVRSM